MAYNSSETVKGKFIGNILFPFSSIQEALDSTTERDRFQERYILIDGVTKIYWFRDGILDVHLIPKFPGDKPFTQVTSSGNETVLDLDVAELFYFDGTNAPLQEDTEIQITGDPSIRLIQLEINQDDVGGWEVTFDAGITLLPNYIIDTAPNSRTVLNFYKNSDDTWSVVSSIYDLSGITGFEPELGNPAGDGYVLSSLIDGTRSWIEVSGVGRFGLEDNIAAEARSFDGDGNNFTINNIEDILFDSNNTTTIHSIGSVLINADSNYSAIQTAMGVIGLIDASVINPNGLNLITLPGSTKPIYIYPDDGLIINSNNITLIDIPEYANDGAADADSNLSTKGLYKITGDRTVYQKP